jgi:DNA polymerase
MNPTDFLIFEKINNYQTKIEQIKFVQDMISSNQKLKKNFLSAENLVFGEGNLDAKIIFIGEAPGKKEDLSGRPFIGTAGRILDQNLSQIGLDRQTTYITNIVKYRPDNNRDPSEAEKNLFLPYLIMQILIINPSVLVTLGRHSLSVFDKSLTINENHGKITTIKFKKINLKFSNYSFKLLPLYHPAATIYNRALKTVLENDFKNLKSYI